MQSEEKQLKGRGKAREAALERARELTIGILLEVKHAYLRAGANAVRHIEQIQDRVRAAARTTAGPEEWYTALATRLHLGPPSSSTSSLLADLAGLVRDGELRASEYLDLVEREHGYLIAEMRVAAEEERANRGGMR